MQDIISLIGKLFPADENRRDAIHIPIAPVVAATLLQPGQHVGFVYAGDTKHVGPMDDPAKCVGIIDPFLREPVPEGSRVGLFVYPNTITSLRHVWSHPSFQVVLPPGFVQKEKPTDGKGSVPQSDQ